MLIRLVPRCLSERLKTWISVGLRHGWRGTFLAIRVGERRWYFPNPWKDEDAHN